jgi:hypothetical protein
LETLGYQLGDQIEGELLIEHWANRDFRPIISYCKKADAFQDSPFSRPFTFQAMDIAFPGSKFVLTVRESCQEWYESMIRYHSLLLEQRKGLRRLPTAEDLKDAPYIYPGYLWRVQELVRGTKEGQEVFDKRFMIDEYNLHNSTVMNYFMHRPADLLVLNVAHESAMRDLCAFLGRAYEGQPMPHINRSQ